MRLRDLLRYDDIVIQCHNDPDADAIASGYGVLAYLRKHEKKARLIYGGTPIQKPNLLLMIRELDIPIEHVESLDEAPELLLTVDCQYGERNVWRFPGRTVAVIDHHMVGTPEALPPLQEVRSN